MSRCDPKKIDGVQKIHFSLFLCFCFFLAQLPTHTLLIFSINRGSFLVLAVPDIFLVSFFFCRYGWHVVVETDTREEPECVPFDQQDVDSFFHF